MIEKLPFEIKETEYEGKILTAKTHTNPYDMQEKINELIDVVNDITDWVKCTDETIVKYGIKPIENGKISKMENFAENGNFAKNAQDTFAEQRKWVGKVCRFWNFVRSDMELGILKSIDERKTSIPYINDIGYGYAYCEPVKPDDDIIYKGE